MNIYLKWFLLVGLNSILGLMIGMDIGQSDGMYFSGMLLGIFTWFIAYVSLDRYLLRTGRLIASQKLLISALLRIPLQLFMIFEWVAGTWSAGVLLTLCGNVSVCEIDNVNYLIGLGGGRLGDQFDPVAISAYYQFTVPYLMTILTGLFLSMLCAIIYMLLTILMGPTKQSEPNREIENSRSK